MFNAIEYGFLLSHCHKQYDLPRLLISLYLLQKLISLNAEDLAFIGLAAGTGTVDLALYGVLLP